MSKNSEDGNKFNLKFAQLPSTKQLHIIGLTHFLFRKVVYPKKKNLMQVFKSDFLGELNRSNRMSKIRGSIFMWVVGCCRNVYANEAFKSHLCLKHHRWQGRP